MRAASVGFAATFLALTALVDEGRTQPAGTTRVSVKITAPACTLSRKRVPAGKVVFALSNKSKIAHSLAVAGKRSRAVKPMRKRTFNVSIRRPGRYRYICAPARGKRGAKHKRGTLVVVKATQPL